MPAIELVLGDITRQQVDVVVNAANSSLLGGGGVDGAIHEAAGPAAARRLPRPAGRRVRPRSAGGRGGGDPGRRPAGPLGDPHCRPGLPAGRGPSDVLASCFRESLRLADELGAASVAFPAVSAGVYRWPIDEVAKIAVGTVLGTTTQVAEVRFVLFSQPALEAFQGALEAAQST